MSRKYVKLLVITAAVLIIAGACAAALADQHVGDHVWGNKTLVEAANCDHPAIYRYTCSVCGATKEEKEGASDPSRHDWGEWAVTTPATCTSTGVKTRVCRNNVHHTETQTIPLAAHTPGDWVTTTAATCTANGMQVRKCTVCGVVVETRNIAALGHDWGGWVTTVAPTCTTMGEEVSTCSRCAIQERRTTAALGHDWSPWATIKAAACTKDGEEVRTCSRCTLQEKRVIPALGHNWGSWVVIKAATCTAAGEEERTCTRGCGQKETRTVAATGHNWGAWVVVTPATCTKGGLEKRTCSRCGLEETRTTDPLGHDWGAWVVVKKATRDQTGLRQRTCKRCGQVQSDEIPIVVMAGNTLCSFGPRLRDNEYAPYVTDKWYMYTPFDASRDGRQTYELVASNMYIVGTVTLDIRDGAITVDYKLDSRQIRMDLEFFTILDTIRDLDRYEPEELKSLIGMPFGTPIPMAENFGDDTELVLYFCCRITYTYDADNMFNLAYDSPAHKALLKDMQALLD